MSHLSCEYIWVRIFAIFLMINVGLLMLSLMWNDLLGIAESWNFVQLGHHNWYFACYRMTHFWNQGWYHKWKFSQGCEHRTQIKANFSYQFHKKAKIGSISHPLFLVLYRLASQTIEILIASMGEVKIVFKDHSKGSLCQSPCYNKGFNRLISFSFDGSAKERCL